MPHVKIFGVRNKFIACATQHGHSFSKVVPTVFEALELRKRSRDLNLGRVRLLFAKKWAARAKKLKTQEEQMKRSLDDNVAAIVQDKRILLF